MNPNNFPSTTQKKNAEITKKPISGLLAGVHGHPSTFLIGPSPSRSAHNLFLNLPWASHGLFFMPQYHRVTNSIINHPPQPSPDLPARGQTTQMQRPSRLPNTHSDTRGGKRRGRSEEERGGMGGGGGGGEGKSHRIPKRTRCSSSCETTIMCSSGISLLPCQHMGL